MEVVIKFLQDTDLSYQQLADFIHAAFEERLEQGLHFTCSSMTAEQFAEKMRDGHTFVALRKDSNDLCGTVTLHLKQDKDGVMYGYHEYLAVSPEVKHAGIGSRMAEMWTQFLKQCGAKYVLSDTACGARSSVQWHLRNGFHIYELESYRSTDYWSYVFIKYLDDSVRKSTFQIKLHYIWSVFFIRATRNKNGTDTALGKICKKLKEICKS